MGICFMPCARIEDHLYTVFRLEFIDLATIRMEELVSMISSSAPWNVQTAIFLKLSTLNG